MRIGLASFWLAIAAGWVAAFLFLGKMAGGNQYISHMGWRLAAALDIAMSVLCVLSACLILLRKPAPNSRRLLFVG